jgi:NDP-sugar pyrophosphorylase family protein
MTTSDLSVTTALVLAGGKGERLKPLTDDRPKPMVLLNGKPILEHHLAWLAANGISRAVLLTGYKAGVIADYFATPRVDGLTVECVEEKQPLGRGGAFRNGYEHSAIGDELVVATNGDVLTDQPLGPMLKLHRTSGALATVLLAPLMSQVGIVEVDDLGAVRDFTEKPRLPYWINAGVYILATSVLAQFPVQGDHETTTFPKLAREGLMAGFRSDAFWKSVETAKDLSEVGEHLAGRS